MYLPAPSILKAVELKGRDKVDDQTLILADMAEKALNQVKELVIELIRDKVGEDKARWIADKLVGTTPTITQSPWSSLGKWD